MNISNPLTAELQVILIITFLKIIKSIINICFFRVLVKHTLQLEVVQSFLSGVALVLFHPACGIDGLK